MGVANYFLHFENCVIDHDWLKQFFEQRPKYHMQKQKLLVVEQKHSYSVYDMSDYSKKFKQVLRKKRITKLDI